MQYIRISWVLILLVLSISSIGQSANKSSEKVFLWQYSLPSSYANGPADITVKGTYYFTKVKIGEKYQVYIHTNFQSLEHNPVIYGTLRYKYEGKYFRQDQLHASDGLGMSGFNELKITSVSISLNVQFLDNPQTVIVNNSGIAYNVGTAHKDPDLEKISINFAGSYLTSANWQGSHSLQNRIKNSERPKQNKNSTTTSNTPKNKPTNPENNSDSAKEKVTPNSQDNSNNANAEPNESIPSELNPIDYSNSNQTPTVDRKELVTKSVEAGISLINLFTNQESDEISEDEYWANQEKVSRENALKKAKIIQDYIQLYNNYYKNKYYKDALSGQDSAKVILIYSLKEMMEMCSWEVQKEQSSYCEYHHFDSLLIQKADWTQELLSKGQADIIALQSDYIPEEIISDRIAILERSADSGSVDAMLILANYFNTKKSVKVEGKFESLSGGHSPIKAQYWYQRAAAHGSPKAAYFLGMISLYKSTTESYHKSMSTNIEYYNDKNYEKAAFWFSQAIKADRLKTSKYSYHKAKLEYLSNFQTGYHFDNSSLIQPDAFIQLSKLYKFGNGVIKNKVLADTLLKKASYLTSQYKEMIYLEESDWITNYHSSFNKTSIELPEIGNPNKSWLGLSYKENYSDSTSNVDEKHKVGLLITYIYLSSPAERAGLKVGDIITALNYTPIIHRDDLVNFLKDKGPGEKIDITFEREGSLFNTKATLFYKP